MILYSKVSEQPESEPVTLNEIKIHLKLSLTSTLEDSHLTMLNKSARRMAEAYTGLSFITQERIVKLDRFPCGSEIILPYGPVTTVNSFTYIDGDGDEQPLVQDTDFNLDTSSNIARVKTITGWPSTDTTINNAVAIGYTAGYAVDEVPEEIKIGILNIIANLYESRQGDGNPMSDAVIEILDTVKVYWNANINLSGGLEKTWHN